MTNKCLLLFSEVFSAIKDRFFPFLYREVGRHGERTACSTRDATYDLGVVRGTVAPSAVTVERHMHVLLMECPKGEIRARPKC